MNTINVENCKTLLIGRRGENEVTTVAFDFAEWQTEFGSGVVDLYVKRFGDESAYPVVLTIDGTVASWLVTETDTNVAGYGKAEYVYRVDGKIAKSAVFPFFVAEDIGQPASEPPDPYESWLEQLTALGAETEANAQAAEQSAENAAQSAEDAAESAASVEGAVEQAEAARDAARAAQTASEAARDAAQTAQASAESSATAASGSADSAAGSATAAASSASDASASASAASDSATAAGDAETQAESAKTAAQAAQSAAEDAAADAQEAAQQAHVEYEQLSGEVDDLSDEVAQQKSAISDTVGFIRDNLYDNVLYYKNLNNVQRSTALTGCTATTDGNAITLTATATTVRVGAAGASNENYNDYGYGSPVSCAGLSKLRFILPSEFSRNYVSFWKSTGEFVSRTEVQPADFVVDIPSDAFICSLRIDLFNATVGNTYNLSVKAFSYVGEPVKTVLDGVIEEVENFKPISFNVYGGYLSSNGTVVAAGDTTKEVYTEFIPSDAGYSYSISLETDEAVSQWMALCLFDKNRAFISRTNLIANITTDTFETTINIINPDVKFIALTYRTYGNAKVSINTARSVSTLSDVIRSVDVQKSSFYNVKGVNHRGFNTIAPENTLPAFAESKKHGFAYVETDVSITSDGVFVLLHDATINRTARNADGTPITGTVNISDITYAQALDYDFGIYKGAEYAGVKIPTLEQFIKFCKYTNLKAYVELKQTAVYTQEQVTSMVALVKKYGMQKSVSWISFNKDYLVYVLNADNKARVGYIADGAYPTKIADAVSLMTSVNDVFIDMYIGNMYDDAVTLCVNADLPVEVWTLNSTTQLINMNPYITGVTTDYLNVAESLYYSQI